MSKVEAVAQYFKARPGIWISALDVARVGGLLSSRTRISELRKPPYSMQIENDTRSGPKHEKVSLYRYVA